jgi:hypothetical protein
MAAIDLQLYDSRGSFLKMVRAIKIYPAVVLQSKVFKYIIKALIGKTLLVRHLEGKQ